MPGPALALRQAGLEENSAKQEFLERLDVGSGILMPVEAGMEESGWIAEEVSRALSRYNLGKPPRIIQAQGDPGTVLGQVENGLRQVPSEEPVPGIPLLTNEPFVALALQVGTPGRTDHILVIDRVGYVHRRIKDVVAGSLKLEEFEFALHLSVHPAHNAVHLHTISLGRELESELRGKGLASTTFEKLVGRLRRDHPEMNISTVAASAVVEYWFGRYFRAHFASEAEYAEVNRYVRVPPSDAPSLLIGQVTPRSGGDPPVSDASPPGPQGTTREEETASVVRALENGDPAALELLRSWLQEDRMHPGIVLDYLANDNELQQILRLLTRLAATTDKPILRNEALSLLSEFAQNTEARRLLPEESWRSVQAWKEGPTPQNVPLVFGALGGPDGVWSESDAYAFGAETATLQSWVSNESSRRLLITTMRQHPDVINPAAEAMLRLMNALILHRIAHTLDGMGLREAAANTLLEFNRYVEFDPVLAPVKESIKSYGRQLWHSPQEAREPVDVRALFDQLVKESQKPQAAPPPVGITPSAILRRPATPVQKKSWLRLATFLVAGTLLVGIAGKLAYDNWGRPVPRPGQKGGLVAEPLPPETPQILRPDEKAIVRKGGLTIPVPQFLQEQIKAGRQDLLFRVHSMDSIRTPGGSLVENIYKFRHHSGVSAGSKSFEVDYPWIDWTKSGDRIIAFYVRENRPAALANYTPFYFNPEEIPGSVLIRVSKNGDLSVLRNEPLLPVPPVKGDEAGGKKGGLEEASYEEFLTDPAQHDPKRFAYIGHAVQIGDFVSAAAIHPLLDGALAHLSRTRLPVSASIIHVDTATNTYVTGSVSPVLLIFSSVPDENLLWVSPSEITAPIATSGQLAQVAYPHQLRLSRTGQPRLSPERFSQLAKTASYSEVIVEGRGITGKRPSVGAVLVQGDDSRFHRDPALLNVVKEWADPKGLKFIALENPPTLPSELPDEETEGPGDDLTGWVEQLGIDPTTLEEGLDVDELIRLSTERGIPLPPSIARTQEATEAYNARWYLPRLHMEQPWNPIGASLDDTWAFVQANLGTPDGLPPRFIPVLEEVALTNAGQAFQDLVGQDVGDRGFMVTQRGRRVSFMDTVNIWEIELPEGAPAPAGAEPTFHAFNQLSSLFDQATSIRRVRWTLRSVEQGAGLEGGSAQSRREFLKTVTSAAVGARVPSLLPGRSEGKAVVNPPNARRFQGEIVVEDLVVGQTTSPQPLRLEIAAHETLSGPIRNNFRGIPIRSVSAKLEEAAEDLKDFTVQDQVYRMVVLDRMLLDDPAQVAEILPSQHAPTFLLYGAEANLLTPAVAAAILKLQLPANGLFLVGLRQDGLGQIRLTIYA